MRIKLLTAVDDEVHQGVTLSHQNKISYTIILYRVIYFVLQLVLDYGEV